MNEMLQTCDLESCMSEEELARLLDDAFATWKTCPRDDDDRRQTPRISATDRKPIYVVGYAIEGKVVALHERAEVVNISADGLGIALAQPIPRGASLCFAFATRSAEPGFGTALVVYVEMQDGLFHMGLSFPENASTLALDPAAENEDDQTGSRPVKNANRPGIGQQILNIAQYTLEMVLVRPPMRRKLHRTVNEREAIFTVEARLSRYRAALMVDGRKVAWQSGALNGRFWNLFSANASLTAVRLEGDGFSACALLSPNNIKSCALDLSVDARDEPCGQAIEHTPSSPAAPDRAADDSPDAESPEECNAEAVMV